MKPSIHKPVIFLAAMLIALGGSALGDDLRVAPPNEAAPWKAADLPPKVTTVMQKFVHFERAQPTRSQWESKRAEVLRFLKAVFDEETAKAELEAAIAIRNAARSLSERTYDDAKLRNILASIAAKGL